VKKYLLLFLVLAICCPVFLTAQTELTVGRTATLGVEATTTFGWDLSNNSTGLETKAGIELIFPLFPVADMGVQPENTDDPSVRLILRNATFSWWNTFQTAGGNYEQDNFNSWVTRPLYLTFDDFFADVLWKNYYFRVASSTTEMRTNIITLRSIFDDVMDANNRIYYRRGWALWREERYNIQDFPLLKNRIETDMLDIDYRNDISGILAFGAEFERFSASFKAASRFQARAADEAMSNIENAWLFGADFEIVPVENLKIDITGFAGINYDKVRTSSANNGRNPLNLGVMAEYRLPLTDDFILSYFLGMDFAHDTVSENNQWEFGAGLMLYTRGFDTRVSSRVLDFDAVIPIGASLAMNINHDNYMNIMLSWFDPAGRDSLIPYFGGFLQLEVGNLLNAVIRETDFETFDYAFLTQLEYSIDEKIVPYVRLGYGPEFIGAIKTPDTAILRASFGCYLTMIRFFTLDLRYEMRNVITTDSFTMDNGMFNAVFTIRM
jgi:hypothetical protein